jgi:hypothetical protein
MEHLYGAQRRNWLQALANATAPEMAQRGENRCRGLRLVAAGVKW